MRASFGIGACVFLLSASAWAQVTPSSSVRFDRVTRENNPRAVELGRPTLDTTSPLGTRDCSCESWRFQGSYGMVQGALNVEYWVGNSPTACNTASSRVPPAGSTVARTCWQLPSSVVSTDFYGSNFNGFNKLVPARYLIDPINGRCNPVAGVTQGQMYFTVVFTPGTSADGTNVTATQAISYNLQAPNPVVSAAAEPQEGGARVRWSATGSTDDGGSSTATTTQALAGYYVLCIPRAERFDGGAARGTCSGTTQDASGVDASTTDVSTTDGTNIDATVDDASTDVQNDSASDAEDTSSEAGDAGGGTCGLELPADFNPNDDTQFERYRCSELLPAAAEYSVPGLVNGTNYRFAVVAQDNAGNRSAPVLTSCVTPVLVTDFWEHYQGRGGTVQPGFCAVRPGNTRTNAGIAALLLGAAVVVGRRVQRRRSINNGSSK